MISKSKKGRAKVLGSESSKNHYFSRSRSNLRFYGTRVFASKMKNTERMNFHRFLYVNIDWNISLKLFRNIRMFKTKFEMDLECFKMVWFSCVLLCGFGWCGLFGLWFVALVGVLVGLVWWVFVEMILDGVGCLTGWPYENASLHEARKTWFFM